MKSFCKQLHIRPRVSRALPVQGSPQTPVHFHTRHTSPGRRERRSAEAAASAHGPSEARASGWGGLITERGTSRRGPPTALACRMRPSLTHHTMRTSSSCNPRKCQRTSPLLQASFGGDLLACCTFTRVITRTR